MLTNKSLCVVLELCQSYELWHWIICTPVVLALSYLLSLLCSLILSIHYTSRQHFTSSKSGIISCTWRCTWKGQDQNWNMRDQTFDSTNAAPSPFSCATSLQAAATIRLSFKSSWIRVDNGHAQCEVNENGHNLVPRYFESKQNDIRLSFFILKRLRKII